MFHSNRTMPALLRTAMRVRHLLTAQQASLASCARHLPRRLLTATALACAMGLAGCGGGGSPSPVAPPPPAPATTLTLSAAADPVVGGTPVALSAALDGAGTVAWQLAAGNTGALSASSGATVNYLPPATSEVYAVGKVAVTATSGSLSKTITLNLLPDPKRPGLYLLAGDTAGVSNASTDGAAAARFRSLTGIGTDADGNAFVTDIASSNLLRKIAPDGRVTTILSPAAYDAISEPRAAVDGSIYFIGVHNATSREYYNTTYRMDAAGKLDSVWDGVFTFVGGIGRVLPSPDGRLYMINYRSIGIWQSNNRQQAFVGGGQFDSDHVDGVGGAARFQFLIDAAAAPDGTVYALESGYVRKITPAGVVTTLADIPAGPAGAPGPVKIAVDGSGNVSLLFTGDDRSYFEIRKVSAGAVVPLHRIGVPGGQYDIRPTGMAALRDGTLLLARRSSVMRLGADGKLLPLAGSDDAPAEAADGDGATARYANPGLLAADTAGNIYSVENVGHAGKPKNVIRKTTPAGQVTTYATLNLDMDISGMLVTPAGQLVVSLVPQLNSKQFGGGVYQVEAGNKFTLLAGAPGANTGSPLQRNDTGAAARFGGPVLAGVDAGGNLYLRDRAAPDSSATTVRKLTPQGAVSTETDLPSGLGAAPDGNTYQISADGSLVSVTSAGEKTFLLSGYLGGGPSLPGPLPGMARMLVDARSVVPLGAKTLAVATRTAILRVVLP